MTQDWRKVELLVKHIEAALSSAGVEIKSPERFYYPDGVQKAEVDVTLRHNIGSSQIFIGLECRLRKSDGQQGADWIREVASKGVSIGAHQMVAVSGTGFNAGAIREAETLNVGLRVVEDEDFAATSNWFRVATFTISNPIWEWDGDLNIQLPYEKPIPKFTFNTPLLLVDGKQLSTKDYISSEIQKRINDGSINLPPRGRLRYLFRANWLLGRIGQKEVLVSTIEVPLLIGLDIAQCPLLVSRYRDPSFPNVIALSAVAEVTNKLGTYHLTVVGTEPVDDPEHRRLNLTVVTLDGLDLDWTNTPLLLEYLEPE